jgi:hypothetical protein
VQSPGKLVRQLVQDGEHVVEGQAFAEIEVMKMIQTLASPAAGVISFSVRHNHASVLRDSTPPGCWFARPIVSYNDTGLFVTLSCVFVHLQVNEGSALTAGALIAKLELDDPTKVKRAENFIGKAAIWATCLPQEPALQVVLVSVVCVACLTH